HWDAAPRTRTGAGKSVIHRACRASSNSQRNRRGEIGHTPSVPRQFDVVHDCFNDHWDWSGSSAPPFTGTVSVAFWPLLSVTSPVSLPAPLGVTAAFGHATVRSGLTVWAYAVRSGNNLSVARTSLPRSQASRSWPPSSRWVTVTLSVSLFAVFTVQ